MLRKSRKWLVAASLIGAAGLASNAMADLDFTDPDVLSENGGANKTKIVRMGSGWLVVPYGDAVGPLVYDAKQDGQRPAQDIFVRVCNPAQNESECSDADDWSEPVNLSNTALETSIDTDWDEDQDPETNIPTAFYGDSDKPNIFVAGSFAAVTWVDKYCPTGNQRMVSYIERDGITVPFSCLYVSYTNNVGSGLWTTERLTDGTRDVKSDANKGLSLGTPAVGNWSIVWQEDPRGLQLGGAEGPGDGASGAKVTHGTDIWYTYTTDLMAENPWAEPTRVTDNFTSTGGGGNANPVFHPSEPGVELEDLEGGKTGSSRPNLMLVAGSTPPTAVIAYEESKGADRTDVGKFVRYHEFPFDSPPGLEPGCIISDPLENSRRVRFVAQPNASTNGLRMGVFWRQGFPTEGGPADIMLRVGTTGNAGTGLSPEDMIPAVDGNCSTSDYGVAKTLDHDAAYNLSSNTIPWSPASDCDIVPPQAPDNNLADTSSHNPYEDARAHRAAIVGDDLYIGYSYVKDWAVSTYTDMDNYNFWLRRYNAANPGALTVAKNISNIDDPGINVKEPRLVKTPGTGPGCQDPLNITNPEHCQDKSTLIVAWGTESNVYSHFQASEEFDIYYSRTRDKAETFEDAVVVPGIGGSNRFESQLRPTPAGNIVYAVWNEKDSFGDKIAGISVSDQSGIEPPAEYDLNVGVVAPESMHRGSYGTVIAYLYNLGPDEFDEGGTVTVTGVTTINPKQIGPFEADLIPMDANGLWGYGFSFRAPLEIGSEIHWTAEISTPSDTNASNDVDTAVTNVIYDP